MAILPFDRWAQFSIESEYKTRIAQTDHLYRAKNRTGLAHRYLIDCKTVPTKIAKLKQLVAFLDAQEGQYGNFEIKNGDITMGVGGGDPKVYVSASWGAKTLRVEGLPTGQTVWMMGDIIQLSATSVHRLASNVTADFRGRAEVVLANPITQTLAHGTPVKFGSDVVFSVESLDDRIPIQYDRKNAGFGTLELNLVTVIG